MKNTSDPLYMRIITYIGFSIGVAIAIAMNWSHLKGPVPTPPTPVAQQTIHTPTPISTKNGNNVIITLGKTNNY